ncbi:SDR family NAD(P)-dependent oxidoreductase [Spirillospora sp. CA-253888]
MTALIAGGTSGLGHATADTLMRRGIVPVLVGRDVETGTKAIAELGAGARFSAGDVTEEDDVMRALDLCSGLGELRIVINCAAATDVARTLGREGAVPLDHFVHVINTNITGTFNVCRLAAERIARLEPADGERGVIINTSSIAAFDGQAGQVAYAASKAAVAGMTLPLARDLAESLIRVVTVAPGMFRTRLTESLPDRLLTTLRDHTPHPTRFGNAHEFAALIEHIVDNRMLNGETIRLDGALRLPARPRGRTADDRPQAPQT